MQLTVICQFSPGEHALKNGFAVASRAKLCKEKLKPVTPKTGWQPAEGYDRHCLPIDALKQG
jgi:hypothetical protein